MQILASIFKIFSSLMVKLHNFLEKGLVTSLLILYFVRTKPLSKQFIQQTQSKKCCLDWCSRAIMMTLGGLQNNLYLLPRPICITEMDLYGHYNVLFINLGLYCFIFEDKLSLQILGFVLCFGYRKVENDYAGV
jgi:hypothetical protein